MLLKSVCLLRSSSSHRSMSECTRRWTWFWFWVSSVIKMSNHWLVINDAESLNHHIVAQIQCYGLLLNRFLMHPFILDCWLTDLSLLQSRVCPTSRPPQGPFCPRITPKATATIWTACGWSSPSLGAASSWPSTTSTWSLPTTSWWCGTASSWDASQAPRCRHTSPAPPTPSSWSSRLTTPCPAGASTSPTAVSKV